MHDFLDPREGYSPEASVNCLDLKLKFFDKKVDENFSSFDLIKMYALKEFSMESKKLSWKGISRFSKNAEFINFENSINIGPNYNIKTTNLYMMAGMFTHVSHFFERGFNINHGGIIGFNSELTHKFRVSFEYITQKSIYSNTHQSDMDLGLSVNLQKNQTLEAHYLDKSIKLANSKRGELTWNFYF